MFAVCASCDRGQRYCSELCRSRRRRNQVRAAGSVTRQARWKRARIAEGSGPIASVAESVGDASSYSADHGAADSRGALTCSVRHLRAFEPLDEPLLPARTAPKATRLSAQGSNFYVFT